MVLKGPFDNWSRMVAILRVTFILQSEFLSHSPSLCYYRESRQSSVNNSLVIITASLSSDE